MPFELVKSEPEWTLALSGVVDIFDAAGLHVAAIEATEAAQGGVLVKLGSVESVDTSITQVLLGLRKALAGTGKTFKLEGVPASVAARWRSAGLAEELA
jgi:anti-anti-sigma regulatory factor